MPASVTFICRVVGVVVTVQHYETRFPLSA